MSHGRQKAHDGLQGGGLAAAVGADHAQELSFVHAKVHPMNDLDRVLLAIAALQALHLKQMLSRLRRRGSQGVLVNLTVA